MLFFVSFKQNAYDSILSESILGHIARQEEPRMLPKPEPLCLHAFKNEKNA